MPSGTYSIKWDNHWTLKLLEAIQGNDAWNRSLFGKSIVKTNDIWKATRDICILLFGTDEAWYTFMHGKGFVEKNDEGVVTPTGEWGSKFKDPVRTKLENLNRAVTSKSLKRKHGFSKRWKQWSDILDSVQRNKLRTACPYYFILHELHDGKPAYIPLAPVAPPTAVPPSAPRPNKRPRQLPTHGDSTEEEDAPKVIKGRRLSPIVVDDTTDSKSGGTDSASDIDEDDRPAVLVPTKPVARRGQMLAPSAAPSHTTVKLSQSAGITHGTSRTVNSPELSADANRKVQQEEADTYSAVGGGQGPWGCYRIATYLAGDSGVEDASDGSEADEDDSKIDESSDRHVSDDANDHVNTMASVAPTPLTVPTSLQIKRWLLAARRPPQHNQWFWVGQSSKAKGGEPKSISEHDRLLRICDIRLNSYLRAFIAFQDKGLVLVGPPIEVTVMAAVRNVREKNLRSLLALVRRFGKAHPMRITRSYTKGKHLRFCIDSFFEGDTAALATRGQGSFKISAFALLEDYDKLYRGLPGEIFDRGKYRFERPSR